MELADAFPLMRGGGAFLVAIGLGILVGAFGQRRWRLVCLIVGAGLGVVIMAVGGATKVIFAGRSTGCSRSPAAARWSH